MITLEACPNCMSIWGVGSEEWEWQQCSCCGWTHGDKIDGDDDFEEDDYTEEDIDQLYEDNNPNDSRNL